MKFPWAYPGAKVICVDADFDSGRRWLISGQEYTIASVRNPPKMSRVPLTASYRGSALSVTLKGGPRLGNGEPMAFAIERFRPPTSEVEKLKQLLKTPTKSKQKEFV